MNTDSNRITNAERDKCGGGDLLVRVGNSWMHLASACYSHQFGDMVTADVLHSIVFVSCIFVYLSL